MDPTVLVAIVGLLGSVCSWLVGRNRWLAKSAQDLALAYESLISDLRLEIDRLKAEVSELREVIKVRTRVR